MSGTNTLDLNDPDDLWAFKIYTSLQTETASYIIKQENMEILHSCLTPPLQDYPVIVREEYKLIWNSVMALQENARNCHGLVVYGQPGIGKTLFLFYALGRAISEHIPVAWCQNPDFYYYFDDSEVRRLDYATRPPLKNLALFDTTSEMESPKGSFVRITMNSFVIQATSPKLSRWHSWSKQLGAKVWVMNVWSAKEIEHLKTLTLTEKGYYDPVQISEYLGPSARQCTAPWENTGDPAKDFTYQPLSFQASTSLLDLLEDHHIEETDQRSGFHKFFFATPDLRFKRPVQLSANFNIKYLLPTKYLRDLILASYRNRAKKELEEWCSKFGSQPQICGILYEALAIQNLWMSQEESTCHFTHNPTVTLPAGLKLSNDVLSTDTPANTIWVAPPGYPALDAVAVTTEKDGRKCFTFLQITIARSHTIKVKGITQIWEKMYDTDTVDWRFVFVVPSQEIGEHYLGELNVINKDKKSQEERKQARQPGGRLGPNSKRDVPIGYMVMKMNEKDRQACVDAFMYEYAVEGGGGDDDEVMRVDNAT